MKCSTTGEKGDLLLIYLNMMFDTFLSLPKKKDMYGKNFLNSRILKTNYYAINKISVEVHFLSK